MNESQEKLPRIVGIGGRKGSGKDTAAEVLVEKYGYTPVAFGNALKKICEVLNPWIKMPDGDFVKLMDLVEEHGWPKAKRMSPEIRDFMQALGTEGLRENVSKDVWINIVKDKLESEPQKRFVVTDIRFPNEGEMVASFGAPTMKTVRPKENDAGMGTDNDVDNHASEAELEKYDFTVEIINDKGIAELHEKVEKFILSWSKINLS